MKHSNFSTAFPWSLSSLAIWDVKWQRFAIEKGDFQAAEQIARKAVEAHPGVFSERIRLVWILLASRRQADAEAELRQAVDLPRPIPIDGLVWSTSW